jgi:uracil-DNA glycosylase family 4
MRQKFPDNVFVAPERHEGSKRLVIAEAPGKTEAEEGRPLVGGSGRIFDALMRKAGVSRESLTIANVMNCRPPDNAFPDSNEARAYCTKEEGQQIIKHCIEAHVKPLINIEGWDRVDLLGEKALRYIGKQEGGINRWRGSIIEIDTEKI